MLISHIDKSSLHVVQIENNNNNNNNNSFLFIYMFNLLFMDLVNECTKGTS